MRNLVCKAALVVVTLASTVAAAPHAKAEVQYPWCAEYREPHGGTNCGFVTYQQCLATISGIGGICYPNPAYPRARAPRR